jgi:hypothetical protein
MFKCPGPTVLDQVHGISMKLPISLGNRFFFRVVFPGTILSAALFRITYDAASVYGQVAHLGYIFAAQIFVLGWLFVILDMPIYMLFEGRRYWPTIVRKHCFRFQRRRLRSLHKTMKTAYERERSANTHFEKVDAQRSYLEAAVELSSFPINASNSLPSVVWPTSLGNLIAAYEQYPRLKYGLDSVFFWPRLWVSLDQENRDEIDNYQAQADGLLYAVASLLIASLVFCAYAIVDKFWPNTIRPLLPPDGEIVASLLCVVAAGFIYKISLHVHRQFGEIFKSVFDQHPSKIEVKDTIELVANVTNNSGLLNELEIVQNMAAWRFLRWHRVRLPGSRSNSRIRLP